MDLAGNIHYPQEKGGKEMIYLIFLASFIVAGASMYILFRDKVISLIGAALYTLMPYRIYVCFDIKDKGQAFFWMIVPLAILCLEKAYASKKNVYKFLFLAVAAVIMALLSRTDAPIMVVGIAVLILAGLMFKRFLYIPVAIVSLAGSVVVNMPYWRFILFGHINSETVASTLIAAKGYYLGKYIMSWLYFDNLPGLGFGLLLALAMIIWYLVNVEKTETESDGKVIAIDKKRIITMCLLSLLLSAMAFHWGIWDIAERVHPIAERFISSIGSPNILFGYGCLVLCIPAAMVIREFAEIKKPIISKLIPLFIIGMNIFAAIFQIVSRVK